MSKRGGDNNFQNRACRKFKDNQKAHLISQDEVFEILEADITEILKQVSNARNHTNGAKYPTYTTEMFSNLSTPLFFYYYVKEHVSNKAKKVKKKKKGKINVRVKMKTDLTEDEIESLKNLLSTVYKKSASNQYPNQQQEFSERNKLISKTFKRLDYRNYLIAKKLGLDEADTRDLIIQVYGDPRYNMKHIHKPISMSNASEKKKIKILKALYEDRFVSAVGAAMTIDNSKSDSLAMLYAYMMDKKLKKRAPYVRAYAEAYKMTPSRYFRIDAHFGRKNRKLIRELKHIDIGYKKAFKNLKGDTKSGKNGKKTDIDVVVANAKKKSGLNVVPDPIRNRSNRS